MRNILIIAVALFLVGCKTVPYGTITDSGSATRIANRFFSIAVDSRGGGNALSFELFPNGNNAGRCTSNCTDQGRNTGYRYINVP